MKTLLFTGASGFLGRNIIPLLMEDKYNIITLDVKNATINCDISIQVPSTCVCDVVLHAAGKAHSVPKTDIEMQSFFNINYQGTVNLCMALENSGLPKSFIFISTVAVYGCEYGDNITERNGLNGNTPYALSKIKAEDYLTEWCSKHNIVLSILRPSLLAGPNPPGNLGAMINGIKTGKYLSIAGGKARKSILMVQDIARLVPLLEERGGIYNVCDNEHPSFSQLEILFSKQLGRKKPLSIPYKLANIISLCGDLIGDKMPINSEKLSKMTHSLTFSNCKAKETLKWEPLNVLENFHI
jgi:nucleoside-diphosphate-sugar epimerase